MNKLKKSVLPLFKAPNSEANNVQYSQIPLTDAFTDTIDQPDVEPGTQDDQVQTILEIDGMTCSSCTGSVHNTLTKVPGVQSVEVSLMTNQAIIEHDSSVSAEFLKLSIDDIGFDAIVLSSETIPTPRGAPLAEVDQISTSKLSVHGMTCSACVESVADAIKALPGVQSVEVSLLTEEAIVQHSSETYPKDIADKVDDCGFEAEVIESNAGSNETSGVVFASPEDEKYVSKVSVHGMTCSSCVESVTAAIKNLTNVTEASVSLITEEAIVNHNGKVTAAEIKNAIDDCGFDASVVSSEKSPSGPSSSSNGNNSQQNAAAFEKVNLKYYGTPNVLVPEIPSVIQKHFPATGIKSVNVDDVKQMITVSYNINFVGIRDLFNCITNRLNVDLLILNANYDVNSSQLKLLSKYKEIKFWKKALIKSLVCGMPVFISGHLILHRVMMKYACRLIPGLYLKDIITLALSSYLQFNVGKNFYISAYKSLKHGSATMDVLVVTSTTISYLFSVYSMLLSILIGSDEPPMLLFDTAVMLFTFICLGKWLESRAKGQTTSSLSELMKLIPHKCEIISDPKKFIDEISEVDREHDLIESTFQTEGISVDLIQLNDILIVKPGAKIPSDATVIFGESEVNESLLTGESMPVMKRKGSEVIGGSINLTNVMYLKVTRIGQQTKLSKIITLVKNAQFKKAPIQKYSDYVASIFVPGIIMLAIVTFFAWFFILKFNWMSETNPFYPSLFIKNKANGDFFNCLKISISVVVIACPCALGLAAPTAIMVGTGIGAKNGILIKGGNVFETLTQVKSILFDKTNTLTTGHMRMTDCRVSFDEVQSLFGLNEEDFWYLVYCLEKNNDHPISRALMKHVVTKVCGVQANGDGILNEKLQVVSVNNVISCGIEGKFNNSMTGESITVKIGNDKLIGGDVISNTKSVEKSSAAEPREDPADPGNSVGTVIYVAINDTYVGNLELSDQLKPDAQQVVAALQSKGIETLMVTGDNFQISKILGKKLNIPLANIYAEVSPDSKQNIVNNVKNALPEGKRVLFIGDGINDAAAISSADIGVSFNDSTDIAASAANVILLDSNLKNLLLAIDLSEKTFRTIKMNFILASVYNLLMVPMAIFGIVNPLLAAGAMSMSSVCVVTSSLRLNSWKPPKI